VTKIYYVTDKAQWSFHWDAHYITTGLKERLGLPAFVTTDPWKLKNQIIHFGDRYTYLTRKTNDLDSSNRIFLTWFHGDPEDPEFRDLLDSLAARVSSIEKIVVPCHITRQALIRAGIPSGQIELIPLGVDLSLFVSPAREQRETIRKEIGVPGNVFCIGSFQKDGAGWEGGEEPKLIKGPDVFLETVSRVFEEHKNMFVLLVGPARGYVVNGLKEIGVPFHHRRLNDYRDIVRYYQALDLYLISSRCEGGPKALLESWATGVPVVSTRVGMAADLIRHEENGMLAEPGEVETLVRHVREMMGDAALRGRCSRQALADVQPYDWSLISESYHQRLYRTILG
jgi:glycosyltransferase involved in cell wall biosynthesis